MNWHDLDILLKKRIDRNYVSCEEAYEKNMYYNKFEKRFSLILTLSKNV